MKKPAIEINKLTKIFGKHVVLNEIDLKIPADKIFGIIGESGSGKTTLLKAIVGFLQPENGNIEFEGKDIKKNMRNVKERFGFATQDNCFYPKLTVKENLEFFGSLYSLTPSITHKNTDKLLKFVELDDARETLAENLSSGMQRRLDIACSLIHDPQVLIMDEPTQDLDPILRKEIVKLIQKINDEGTTVILTSHLLYEAEILCDEIAILHEGKILEVGTPSQLKNMYSKNEEIHLESYPGKYESIVRYIKSEPIEKIEKRGHKIIIYTKNAAPILQKLLRALERSRENIINLDVRRPSLNEVFEALVKKGVKNE